MHGLKMVNTNGAHIGLTNGLDMGKYNQSHIGCLHWPKVVPTKAHSMGSERGNTYRALFAKTYG